MLERKQHSLFKRLLFDNRGMGIAQVMVIMGVVGVASFFVMTSVEKNNKLRKAAMINITIDELHRSISVLLTNPKYCSYVNNSDSMDPIERARATGNDFSGAAVATRASEGFLSGVIINKAAGGNASPAGWRKNLLSVREGAVPAGGTRAQIIAPDNAQTVMYQALPVQPGYTGTDAQMNELETYMKANGGLSVWSFLGGRSTAEINVRGGVFIDRMFLSNYRRTAAAKSGSTYAEKVDLNIVYRKSLKRRVSGQNALGGNTARRIVTLTVFTTNQADANLNNDAISQCYASGASESADDNDSAAESVFRTACTDLGGSYDMGTCGGVNHAIYRTVKSELCTELYGAGALTGNHCQFPDTTTCTTGGTPDRVLKGFTAARVRVCYSPTAGTNPLQIYSNPPAGTYK